MQFENFIIKYMHVAFLTYYQSMQVFLALTISSHKNRNIFALLAGLEYVAVNLSLIIIERSIKILQANTNIQRNMEPVGVATEEDEANNIPKKLDAGALFVLKSRGIN